MEKEELKGNIHNFYSEPHIHKILGDYELKCRRWVILDFYELAKFSPELAQSLLDDPKLLLPLFRETLTKMDMKPKNVRFHNLPLSSQRSPWQIRNNDIGKFLAIRGNISLIDENIAKLTSVTFQCSLCGKNQIIKVINNQKPAPHICECAGKTRFTIINKSYIDLIKLKVSDDLSYETNFDRTLTRSILCYLEDDMADIMVDKKLEYSKKVVVNGHIEVQNEKFVAIANYIEFPKIGWDTVHIDDKTEKKIQKLSKEPDIVQRLGNSVVDVIDEPELMTSCMLQLAGAPNIYNSNNLLDSRGTIHILLIGDPGTAKSQLAKAFLRISPIRSFQTCATASGKGLVASVINDPDIGSWAVYPGVVPMANKGMVVLDEMDKTHKEDYGDHNNAMADMVVTVAKANVKAVLSCETAYLGTANPKFRIWNDYEPFINQIDMPQDFIDRFDLIFAIKLPVDSSKKSRIIKTILNRHDNQNTTQNKEFTLDFIQKYVAYARRYMPRPKLDKKFYDIIEQRILDLMRAKEGDTKISMRHLESIIRLCYASARLRLDDINETDIDLVFNLKTSSFKSLKIIDSEGYMTFEVEANVPVEKKNIYESINEAVTKLQKEDGYTDIQDIVEELKQKGMKENKVEHTIWALVRDCTFTEIRGRIRKL